MTTFAKIGPFELSQAHEIVDPESDPGKFKISIKCPPEQAKQLVGLCQPTQRSENVSPRIISSQKSRWGILPIESPVSSVIPIQNEYTGLIKGLCVLSNPMEYFINIKKSRVVMDAEVASQNTNEILTILHSKGGEDASDIEMSEDYSDTEIESILAEEFTSFDDTNIWHPKYTQNMAAGADIVASGGKLVFSGASATNLTWSYLWTVLRETLPDDFEAEFTLEWNALPASGAGPHHLSLFLMDGKPANSTELEYKDTLRMVLDVRDTGALISVDKRVRGNYNGISADYSLTSAQKIIAVKIKLEGGTGVSMFTVWIDKNYSGTGNPTYGEPIFGPANTGFNYDNDMYLLLAFENASSTSATAKCSFLNISQTFDALKPNIVVAPVGAVLDRTPDFYRVSEDGNIPCFKNPVTPPTFQIDPEDFYKGTVKAMNTNYTDAVSRLVTDNEFDLDPTKFTLSNGLIKLVPGAQSVTFQYWNGTAWVTSTPFTLPNPIRLIRPFLVTKDRFILQIDRTLWEMKSGSYGIWVKHESDALGYPAKTSYYHDGVLNNGLAAGADVSMLTQFYCNIYDNSLAFNTALSELDIGTERIANICFIGDSITEDKYAGLTSPEMELNGYVGKINTFYEEKYGNVGKGLMTCYLRQNNTDHPWRFPTTPGLWEYDENSGDYGVAGNSYRTNVNEAYVNVYFNGTGYKLLYVKGPDEGAFVYQIDGGSAISVDAYSAAEDPAAVLTISGLPAGDHILRIEKGADGLYNHFIGGYETNENTNLIDSLNVQTGTDTSKNTGGFHVSAGVTPESSLEWSKKGERSFKFTTDGAATYQGYRLDTLEAATPGLEYTVEQTVYGLTGTVIVGVAFYDGSSTLLAVYDTVTLDGKEHAIQKTGTAPAGTIYVSPFVSTGATAQAISVNVDEIKLVLGDEVYAEGGVKLHRCAIGGSHASYHVPHLDVEIDTFEPELTVVAFGANDFNSQTPLVDFESDLELIILKGMEYGDVVIMPLGKPLTTDKTIPYQSYVDVMEALAVKYGLPYVDIYTTEWDADCYYDNVHPNAIGHNIISEEFIAAVYPTNLQRGALQVVSPSPRTIKSNSIPANSLTGFIVYNQLLDSNDDNGYISLAREWFRPTWQTLLLQSEV